MTRRRGRPPGSIDRNGYAARVDRRFGRSARWRGFCRAFGQTLRERREDRNIAATELAAAISASPMTIHAWERGRSVPAVATLLAIAVALGCTLVDLLPEQSELH